MSEKFIKRIEKIEDKKLPRPAPVVLIEEGEPIPEGAEVVLIDNIPKEPIVIKGKQKPEK
jgi:hypothetical protein